MSGKKMASDCSRPHGLTNVWKMTMMMMMMMMGRGGGGEEESI